MRPKLLIIGHLDASGRHGIAAGMRAAETLGAEALPVVTCYAFGDEEVPKAIRPVWGGAIGRQLDAALAREPEAVLVGTVARPRHARLIGARLSSAGPPAVVVAPMPSAFGLAQLIPARTFPAIRQFLVPEARSVVLAARNIDALFGDAGDDLDGFRAMGQRITGMGADSAWIRAIPNESRRVDIFVDQNGSGLLDYQPAGSDAEPHTSAASLAALLALGTKLREAVGRAHRHAYGLDRELHAV